MRFLTISEVLDLYSSVIEQTGGAYGLRSNEALESALAQVRVSFGGSDLYPTLIDKAASLAFSLIMNHPFVDGNKRIGHATMETFLILNGFEINAATDEQEKIIMKLASGKLNRGELAEWLKLNIKPLTDD